MMQQSWQDDLQMAGSFMISKDQRYTLFKWEDWPAWVIFTCAFIVLVLFDNYVIFRSPRSLTVLRAVLYTMFWVACACGFCTWIYFWMSPEKAFMWMSGYMLEWMLSFDNLFVFHMIFKAYGTPDHQKHTALYLGICGAVFFRIVFIFVGEYLMHAMFFTHILFGSFLVHTGVKTVYYSDDEEEDPSQNPIVQWLEQRVPFVAAYDSRGSFFVQVPVDERGQALVPELAGRRILSPRGRDEESVLNAPCKESYYGTLDFSANKALQAQTTQGGTTTAKRQMRGTMLLLVVFCLEVSDLLFAVDSVSAIVAQVNDLYLAYTSAVFAMLGLRATFFIIDTLIKMFSLLKYGVGFVLIFIGLKLTFNHWYHLPAYVVCIVLVSAIATSMLASVLKDFCCPTVKMGAPSPNAPRRTMNSPPQSPQSPYDEFLTPEASPQITMAQPSPDRHATYQRPTHLQPYRHPFDA